MKASKLANVLGIEKRALVSTVRKHRDRFAELGDLNPELNRSEGRPSSDFDLNDKQVLLAYLMSKNKPLSTEIIGLINDESVTKIRDLLNSFEPKKKKGFVYVISANGKSKIGRTTIPEKRISAIMTQAGIDSKEANIFVSDEIDFFNAVEVSFFRSFKKHRASGEWFDMDFETATFELQSIICNMNHKFKIDCGCFVCSQLDIAYAVCNDHPSWRWKQEMLKSGLGENDCDRWLKIFEDLGVT